MGKAVIFVIAVVFLVLALSSVALAASPQDIYNDYADNQKLDGTYTRAELQAFLDSAPGEVYGSQGVLTALDALVTGMLAEGGHETFPFTGAELALVGIGALALIGGGVGIRRLVRTRS